MIYIIFTLQHYLHYNVITENYVKIYYVISIMI